ncbi:uncharacterized protein BXZ73DRAFT_103586 [Epithele typhae]|uniref:uncharacterized protein n=1 Tax=Epithele typhae TaxID=378194 RepID=UPI0020078A87|nr:uncharacterized protein BXZ73DRAFT_103586 [Epithele typhae]KAH9924299.1 hypothetical protein BXZ73DRAFT_103586 [Epithele typhae]
MIPPPQPPNEATDIFSISDQVLADRLQFIEEIGFGNWGSVWLCCPKGDTSSSPLQDSKIAVKLVHRSKTSTTAARVRSLWNEMKVVRSLKHEPHPSIIPFYSFIITPSYALITMAYHPRLITVEVSESHAKEWFRSLLSGVEFLHKHGVVHNDIKPANILLSNENVPVLVDFGFAERYDLQSSEAFHSNLSYGTPEYLSPERARGLPHDTRKSDVWSLGVTFFEILVGRTMFELSEGEQFSTKADLEKYWARTLRGKWVGTWTMSKGVEKLLRRMVLPNADLRCTASQAMADPYWTQAESLKQVHRKSASVSHSRSSSLILDKEMTKLLDVIPPWASRGSKDKDKAKVEKDKGKAEKDKGKVAGKENVVLGKKDAQAAARSGHGHTRSASQPKLQLSPEARGVAQSKRQHAMPSVFSALSPIKHSPPPSTATFSAMEKENPGAERSKGPRVARKPLGPRSPSNTPPSTLGRHASKENAHAVARVHTNEKAATAERRRSRALRDVTHGANVSSPPPAPSARVRKAADSDTLKSADTSKDSVRSRMMDWERERERLRELERQKLREAESEVDDDGDAEHAREEEWARERRRMEEETKAHQERVARDEEAERREVAEAEAEAERQEREREHLDREERRRREYILPKISVGPALVPETSLSTSPLSPLFEEPSEPPATPHAETSMGALKQSLRMSIGNAVRLYKSSTHMLGRSTPALTLGSGDADDDSHSLSEDPSWDDDAQREEARMDRMTLWIQSVERVVDEARQNFEASSPTPIVTPAALPIAPISRRSSANHSGRGQRVPRKILAANEIFVNDYEPETYARNASMLSDRSGLSSPLPSPSYLNATYHPTIDTTLPTIPSEAPSTFLDTSRALSESPSRASSVGPSEVLPPPQTPSRKRRATVVTRSPDNVRAVKSLDLDLSPSKRREKSRSHGDLLRPITPITKLEFELERLSQPAPPPRLSSVVDKSLFIASSPMLQRVDENTYETPQRQKNELTASPLHIESYPPKTMPAKGSVTLDTPAKRQIEGVYDRFLMSTTGVKRNGKGYQSYNANAPVENINPVRPQTSMAKRSQKFFTARPKMPPPVSSDDIRRQSSFDEFGAFMSTPAPGAQEQNHKTITIVRNAFKAIVTGKPTSRVAKPVWH